MSVGRKREPINLLVLKGKKHLSKEEIETRKEQEIKAPSDKVDAPGYMPKELKLEFRRIAGELKKIELIANLDVDTLARFILAREQYNRTMDTLRGIDPYEDILLYNKTLQANNILFQQCRACAADLGLSITSRCRLLVPKQKDKTPEESAFDQRFGGV